MIHAASTLLLNTHTKRSYIPTVIHTYSLSATSPHDLYVSLLAFSWNMGINSSHTLDKRSLWHDITCFSFFGLTGIQATGLMQHMYVHAIMWRYMYAACHMTGRWIVDWMAHSWWLQAGIVSLSHIWAVVKFAYMCLQLSVACHATCWHSDC